MILKNGGEEIRKKENISLWDGLEEGDVCKYVTKERGRENSYYFGT